MRDFFWNTEKVSVADLRKIYFRFFAMVKFYYMTKKH